MPNMRFSIDVTVHCQEPGCLTTGKTTVSPNAAGSLTGTPPAGWSMDGTKCPAHTPKAAPVDWDPPK